MLHTKKGYTEAKVIPIFTWCKYTKYIHVYKITIVDGLSVFSVYLNQIMQIFFSLLLSELHINFKAHKNAK